MTFIRGLRKWKTSAMTQDCLFQPGQVNDVSMNFVYSGLIFWKLFSDGRKKIALSILTFLLMCLCVCVCERVCDASTNRQWW